jgi:L-lactate dehydrogenase
MPAIVGKDGVECLVPIQLSQEEISKLQKSAKTLQNTLSQNKV